MREKERGHKAVGKRRVVLVQQFYEFSIETETRSAHDFFPFIRSRWTTQIKIYQCFVVPFCRRWKVSLFLVLFQSRTGALFQFFSRRKTDCHRGMSSSSERLRLRLTLAFRIETERCFLKSCSFLTPSGSSIATEKGKPIERPHKADPYAIEV